MSQFSDVRVLVDEVKTSLRGKKLVLFLDYDGTLAEVNEIPDNTYMTKDMTSTLEDITKLEDVMTVAISGRKTEDLQRRIGMANVVYSGNHGLEMCMDGLTGEFTYNLEPEALQRLRTGIKNIVSDLKTQKLGKECGGNIEEKDKAMTWHYFQVPEDKVEEIVEKACAIVDKNGFPVSEGAGCIEVRHPDITKGDAMKKILYNTLGANWFETHAAIFIGDSGSDEEGYVALLKDPEFNTSTFTFIRILENLEKTTTGQYVMRGPDDVYVLLNALRDFYSC